MDAVTEKLKALADHLGELQVRLDQTASSTPELLYDKGPQYAQTVYRANGVRTVLSQFVPLTKRGGRSKKRSPLTVDVLILDVEKDLFEVHVFIDKAKPVHVGLFYPVTLPMALRLIETLYTNTGNELIEPKQYLEIEEASL